MRNKFEIRGDQAIIYFTRRDRSIVQCLIDAADIPRLSDKHSLYLSRSDYSRETSCSYVKIQFGGNKQQYLHRFLLDAPDGKLVDHINGDTLDNRKRNLRIVTPSENVENQNVTRSDSTSGMKGVSFLKNRNRWRAYITIAGKAKHLGCFGTAKEAKEVADKARSMYMPASPEARAITANSDKELENNRIRPNNKTGFPNVSWNNRLRKWNVKIRKNRIIVINRHYADFAEAAKVAKEVRENLNKLI